MISAKPTTTHGSCAICHTRPANQTNSHIIPSFFIAMASSVDGSYKRGRELLYTIGERTTTVFVGRSVLEEELLKSFDFLSDERINYMSRNTDSKDYIFCPHCERKLGEYLESPWHDHIFYGKEISPDVAYFFWVSILWRISAFEGINLKLPTHIEKALGKRLNSYIHARDNKEDITTLLQKPPFRYKILYCKDFSKSYSGFVYPEYDKKSKIATMLLGDVAVCFTFDKHGSFAKHSFNGMEKAFESAYINDGTEIESFLSIKPDIIKAVSVSLAEKIHAIRLKADRNNILAAWKLAITKLRMPLPPKPDEAFIQYVISELYNESVKTGEKTTYEFFAKCFGKGLEKIYGIRFKNN